MDLHESLKGKSTIDGKIKFYRHISKVKKETSNWLRGIPKNGIDHSRRLEDYLNRLIPDDLKKKFRPAEVFILLYAVYSHDIGYKKDDGTIEAEDHPERSKQKILNEPATYLFGDFPSMAEEPPRAAQAVAEVCYGHADESICPLNHIPNRFPDAYLCPDLLDLRLLVALLRLADEIDQPYIRLGPLREHISLVEVGTDIVRWHWEDLGRNAGVALEEQVQKTNKALKVANDYLYLWGLPVRTVVLEPSLMDTLPLPIEPKDYKAFIPKHYIPPRCQDESGEDKGPLHDYVHHWLNDPKRRLLAVLGDYGIGKTSFCYKLASDLMGSQWIPIVVELQSVRKKGWREVIQEEVDSRTLLILDGFDELSLTFDKKTVLKEIKNLSHTTGAYPKVILTSRTQFFRDVEEEKETLVYRVIRSFKRGHRPLTYPRFERIYISPFDDEQVRQYLTLSLRGKAGTRFLEPDRGEGF